MSGTLDLPPKGFFTPPRQKIPSPTTPGTSYSPAVKLNIGTPELLRQAKEGQDEEEKKAAAAKKGGKSRRRKGSKKARKTRRRKSRK